MITKQESIEFVITWNRIKKEALELCRLQNYGSSWYAEGLHDITDEGLVFYDQVQRQYDEGDEIETRVLTWDDFLNYEQSFKIAQDAIELRKQEDARKREEWERNQYETLKKRYE